MLWLRQLLGHPVVGPENQHLGHVCDVVVRRVEDAATRVVGVIVDSGGELYYAPAPTIRERPGSGIALTTCPRPLHGSRGDELRLAGDVLDKPVLDGSGQRHRVADVALRRAAGGWVVVAVDTRRTVSRLLGSPRRVLDWDVLVTRRALAEAGVRRQARSRIRSTILR